MTFSPEIMRSYIFITIKRILYGFLLDKADYYVHGKQKKNVAEQKSIEKINARKIEKMSKTNERNKSELDARNESSLELYEKKNEMNEKKMAEALDKIAKKLKGEAMAALEKRKTEYFELPPPKVDMLFL